MLAISCGINPLQYRKSFTYSPYRYIALTSNRLGTMVYPRLIHPRFWCPARPCHLRPFRPRPKLQCVLLYSRCVLPSRNATRKLRLTYPGNKTLRIKDFVLDLVCPFGCSSRDGVMLTLTVLLAITIMCRSCSFRLYRTCNSTLLSAIPNSYRSSSPFYADRELPSAPFSRATPSTSPLPNYGKLQPPPTC